MSTAVSIIEDIKALSDVSGYFNPFKLLQEDPNGMISSISGSMIAYGAAITAVMFALRQIRFLNNKVEGDENETIVSSVVDLAFVILMLVGYSKLVTLFPSIFSAIGSKLLAQTSSPTSFMIADTLQDMGEEGSSIFTFITTSLSDASIGGILAAFSAVIALVSIWILSFLQPYFFTLWYILGPLLIPCYLYPPFRKYAANWFYSLMAVSFWSPVAGIVIVILSNTGILRSSYASGQIGDYVTSLICSFICIITIFSIPGISSGIFGGISQSIVGGLNGAKSASSAGSRVATGIGVAASTAGRATGSLGRLASAIPGAGVALAVGLKATGKAMEKGGKTLQGKPLIGGGGLPSAMSKGKNNGK